MTTVDEAERQAAREAQARRIGVEPWQLEMATAVPTNLIQDVVREQRHGVAPPSSLIPEKPQVRGTGWSDPAPLGPPAGAALIDRLVAAQDAKDRREG